VTGGWAQAYGRGSWPEAEQGGAPGGGHENAGAPGVALRRKSLKRRTVA